MLLLKMLQFGLVILDILELIVVLNIEQGSLHFQLKKIKENKDTLANKQVKFFA